jgi:hypothetical protein
MGCAKPNPLHWEDLRNQQASEILAKPGLTGFSDGHSFEVAFLNATYLVDPVSEHIAELKPMPERPLSQEFQILLIRYLTAPNGGPLLQELVSEKDFPGGVTFFQGPHAMPVEPIIDLYGNKPLLFLERGRELGAFEEPYGDAALRFSPFPSIPVTYILWRADDEFSASVKILFDKSITNWFELDMIFALVLVLTGRIVEKHTIQSMP